MLRCKICKVPLSGWLGKISYIFFKVKPAKQNPEICNKCSESQKILKASSVPEHLKGKKYECQICGRMIHEEHSLEHIKAEEYLIDLIKKDHKQWQHGEPTCRECIEYYRRLVKETEI